MISRLSTVDCRLSTALLAAGLRLANGPLTVDDAYITLRYARNLADGAGFAYNPGQPVLGTTTPLWTLLLAALYRTTAIDLPLLALGLNAAFDAATAWLLYVLARRLGAGRGAALAASLLFASAPMSVAYAAGGMEASLFVLLLCLAALAATSGRTAVAAGLAGAATLARPEGLLAGVLLLADQARRERRLPLLGLAAFLAPLLPWLVFATLTFGSPLPQSMAAKAGAYQVSPLANALALALQPGLPGLSLFLLAAQPLPGPALAVLAAVVAACLGLFATRLVLAAPSAGRATLPLALFPVAYVVAYAAVGLRGVRMFHWYLVPLVPGYCVLLALAARRLGSARLLGGRAWLAYAALALWWLPGYGLLGAQPLLPSGFSIERERLYTRVAVDYGQRWDSQTVVAAPEIGALGFHSRARILDTVGLVSPEAARFPVVPELLASDNAVSPALLQQAQPDYLVSLDQFVRRSLLPDPWFQQAYRLVEARPARVWESERLLIYRRDPQAPN
ncbi:MAG: hypothetical protein HY690_20390 [Chloroflexi bacterium]|nr:hypothetical protein [Chloroflexota bacterium]